MNHEQAERLLSARIDGEHLSPRAEAALGRHLSSCATCAAFERGAYRLRDAARFELAPAVPDLVQDIMASVQAEPRPAGLRVVRPARSRRALLPRLAPAVAGLLVGAIAGSLVVGGPWQDRPRDAALAAAEVTEGVAAAAMTLDAYQATFAITERNLSVDVSERDLTMRVWFEAPERFRLDIDDETEYPADTTPTDLRLVVDGSDWYAAGPAPCPSSTCPQRESLVRNRLPFSTSARIPTDLVLPLTTLADAGGVTVLGRGEVLGRSAVRVEVPFERAAPLFPFLDLGLGEWRPFFPRDRVRIWLDERSWFPLRWEVFPATGAERDDWALRFGLPEEPSREPVFSAVALEASMTAPRPGVFDIPTGVRAQDEGAREIGLTDLGEAAGFEPVAPTQIGGLELYRAVLPQGGGGGTLLAYADGLSYVALGESRGWSMQAPFGPVGLQAEEIALSGGGVAYFEPATADYGRRISIHAAGTDLYLETNLPRDALLAAAAALPVEGLPMPETWRVRELDGATVSRVSLEQARTMVAFDVELPRHLPPGFGFASAELVDTGTGLGVTLYLRSKDADAGIGTIRLHLEAAAQLPPATSATQVVVDVGDARGRFTPDRAQLEWVDGGLYRSLDAPGLSLEQLVAIAASIGADTGEAP